MRLGEERDVRQSFVRAVADRAQARPETSVDELRHVWVILTACHDEGQMNNPPKASKKTEDGNAVQGACARTQPRSPLLDWMALLTRLTLNPNPNSDRLGKLSEKFSRMEMQFEELV